MSSRSKRKGSSYELEVVRWHQAQGIEAKKTPLSGALEGYPGDVHIAGMIGECKRSRKKCTRLYNALEQGGGSDVLFIRDDGKETLVVLPLETWAKCLEWAEISQKFPHTGENKNG